MKNNKKVLFTFITAILLIAIVFLIVWGNTAIKLNTYTVKSEKTPEALKGYRIAHVSDLHNTKIGDSNEKLLKILEEAEPDIIAITGDIIDSRKTDVDVALHFAKEAVKIAPCYYVSGNHEARTSEYDELKSGLVELGVAVLENASVEIEHNGEKILLIGLDDPSFKADYLFGDEESVVRSCLSELIPSEDRFTLLLSHRPEMFDTYADFGIDLVLSGHAHGGQFRLPFIGGVVAPNQGFFPEYDAGLYTKGSTNMIVSRGIGNSIIPFRINNRPEIILIELG